MTRSTHKGFTLIELLVYIGLIALIGTAVVRVSIGLSNARNKNFATKEVQAHGRTAVQLISQRVRLAESFNIASSTFGSDPGVLSLTMADASKNPTVIDLTEDNGQLRITEGTSDPIIVSNNSLSITDLTFTDLTSTAQRENVRVELTVSYTPSSQDIHFDATETFQTSISVRQ